MKNCNKCGYYGMVVCEKTGGKLVWSKYECEDFKSITLSKYSRICDNCRFYDKSEERCSRFNREKIEKDSDSECIYFASNRVRIKSGRCKDCKFYSKGICKYSERKTNSQFGCKNFISYI